MLMIYVSNVLEGCSHIWMYQVFAVVHGSPSIGIRLPLTAVTGNMSISSLSRPILRSFIMFSVMNCLVCNKLKSVCDIMCCAVVCWYSLGAVILCLIILATSSVSSGCMCYSEGDQPFQWEIPNFEPLYISNRFIFQNEI